MASVQELIAAQEAETSPLIRLLEGVAGGVDVAQNNQYDNAIKLMQIQQAKQAAEFQREQRARLRGISEGKSPFAKDKLKETIKETISVDEKGNFSFRYEQPDVPRPVSIDSYEKALADKYNKGEISLSEFKTMMEDKNAGITPSLQYQMQKDQEKKGLELKTRNIPGFERTPGIEIEDTEAKKLRESVSEFASFNKTLGEYKALIKQYGTQEITNPEVQGKMDAYAKNLQLKVKNLAQLGVLSISDIPFIEKQIQDPGLFRLESKMIGGIDTTRKMMERSLLDKMKVSGYIPTKEFGGGEFSGELPQVGETFNGGKVLSIKRIE